MVWSQVEHVIASSPHLSSKMQVVRIRDGDLKLVGVLIPNHCVKLLKAELAQGCEDTEEFVFED